jgi:hypothetical protein
VEYYSKEKGRLMKESLQMQNGKSDSSRQGLKQTELTIVLMAMDRANSFGASTKFCELPLFLTSLS